MEQPGAVDSLRGMIRDRSVPNILFIVPRGEGPPVVDAFARAFYGQSAGGECTVIHAKFDPSFITSINRWVNVESLYFPFRMIGIIDVDSMLDREQEKLYRIIGENVKAFRFMLTCNDASRVIDDIKTRCAIVTTTTGDINRLHKK